MFVYFVVSFVTICVSGVIGFVVLLLAGIGFDLYTSVLNGVRLFSLDCTGLHGLYLFRWCSIIVFVRSYCELGLIVYCIHLIQCFIGLHLFLIGVMGWHWFVLVCIILLVPFVLL